MNGAIPAQCKSAESTVKELEAELEDAYEEVQNAKGSGKASAGQHAFNAYKKLQEAKKALNHCLIEAGVPPPPQPLDATFVGAYSVSTTHPNAPGPFRGTITIGCRFSSDRTYVIITYFPAVVTDSFPLGGILGSDQVTITEIGLGSGSFDQATGAMAISLSLNFHHSSSFLSDSTLALIMDTGTHTSLSGALTANGSPMDAQGMITLAGVGIFSNGNLGGSEASVFIAGQVSPHP